MIEAGNLVTWAHVEAMYLGGESDSEIFEILINIAPIDFSILEDKKWIDIIKKVIKNENGFFSDK